MTISTHRGYTYHDLTSSDHEELAAAVHLRREQTGGVMFARKMHRSGQSLPGKSSARAAIGALYRSRVWPTDLRILTMPGLKWPFEKALIQSRYMQVDEQKQLVEMGLKPASGKTLIVAVENDPAIFRASLHWLPQKHSGLNATAINSVSSAYVEDFRMTNVETYITAPTCEPFDAAWLDFTGFITELRMEAMKHFWRTSLGCQLTVTSMDARHEKSVTRKMREAGGLAGWIQSELGGYVVDSRRYSDGVVPMVQVTMRKPESLSDPRYVGYSLRDASDWGWFEKSVAA